jgi:hypothetical protein
MRLSGERDKYAKVTVSTALYLVLLDLDAAMRPYEKAKNAAHYFLAASKREEMEAAFRERIRSELDKGKYASMFDEFYKQMEREGVYSIQMDLALGLFGRTGDIAKGTVVEAATKYLNEATDPLTPTDAKTLILNIANKLTGPLTQADKAAFVDKLRRILNDDPIYSAQLLVNKDKIIAGGEDALTELKRCDVAWATLQSSLVALTKEF